nr:hypothetical protein [uncultured bacterium]|tara:strand:- start:2568 stop:2759 length:192 start_codon:yes stop_codon:yes gene_type:complete
METKMERIVSERFNHDKLTVWFVIDNIRYYDENQIGEIAVFKTANNALNTALNYVKTKFNLKA